LLLATRGVMQVEVRDGWRGRAEKERRVENHDVAKSGTRALSSAG
jgi:hypothetical protein